MSFFKQLRDEVHDRNIEMPDVQVESTACEPEHAEPEVDPEYPEHPDYIALRPNLTERMLWKMPAIRFYSTIICFAIGMVLFGIVNTVLGLDMTKGAVGWYQIFGGAAGFLLSKEIFEPRLRIPFSAGTPEQKKAAAEAYVAEIHALDAHIAELRKMRGVSDSDE